MPYGCQQPALVADWRQKWHASSQGQTSALFPFGICEISAVIDVDGLGVIRTIIAGICVAFFQECQQ